MDIISALPTRNDVVRETMKKSLNVAIGTHQEYGVVTYDLAITLNAYSIQALDAPRYDKLFIILGNFHLELAFYGAIDILINEGGVEYLLTESGILAEESLMSFIRGKHFNRCVRIHDILALVMESKLHDTTMSTLAHGTKDALSDLLSNGRQDCGTQKQFIETSPIFQQHMVEFDVYFKKAINADLGPMSNIGACMSIW